MALAALLAVLAPAKAEAALLCEASTGPVPTVAPVSAVGVADLIVTCTGQPSVAGPLNVTAFFNTDVVAGSTPILSAGGVDFAGSLVQVNAIAFVGVPLVPDLGFRISGVSVNTALLAPSPGFTSQVVAFISGVPAGALSLGSPQQVVAVVAPSQVPEPALLALLAIGIAVRRRRP